MFMPMGSINDYVKSMEMQRKAMDSFKKSNAHIFGRAEEKDIGRISQIRARLSRGSELSAADLAYLKKHEPELYSKAVKIAQERKELEQKIKSCKTKEDLISLRLHKYSSLIGMDLDADVEFTGMRTMAINDVFNKHPRRNLEDSATLHKKEKEEKQKQQKKLSKPIKI